MSAECGLRIAELKSPARDALLLALFASPFVVIPGSPETVVPQWIFAGVCLLAGIVMARRSHPTDPTDPTDRTDRRKPPSLWLYALCVAVGMLWSRNPIMGSFVALQALSAAAAYSLGRRLLDRATLARGAAVAGLAVAAMLLLELGGVWPWPWRPGLSPGALFGNRAMAGVFLAFCGAVAAPPVAGILLAAVALTRSWSAMAVAVVATPLFGWRIKTPLLVAAVFLRLWMPDTGSLAGRQYIWSQAARQVRSAPVLGIGAGSFAGSVDPARLGQAIDGRADFPRVAHWAYCEPLQAYLDGGPLAAAALCVFLGRPLFGRRGGHPYTVAWCALALVWWPMHHAATALPFFAFLGMQDRPDPSDPPDRSDQEV